MEGRGAESASDGHGERVNEVGEGKKGRYLEAMRWLEGRGVAWGRGEPERWPCERIGGMGEAATLGGRKREISKSFC